MISLNEMISEATKGLPSFVENEIFEFAKIVQDKIDNGVYRKDPEKNTPIRNLELITGITDINEANFLVDTMRTHGATAKTIKHGKELIVAGFFPLAKKEINKANTSGRYTSNRTLTA